MNKLLVILFLTSCSVNVSEVTNEGDGKVITKEKSETQADAKITPSLFQLF